MARRPGRDKGFDARHVARKTKELLDYQQMTDDDAINAGLEAEEMDGTRTRHPEPRNARDDSPAARDTGILGESSSVVKRAKKRNVVMRSQTDDTGVCTDCGATIGQPHAGICAFYKAPKNIKKIPSSHPDKEKKMTATAEKTQKKSKKGRKNIEKFSEAAKTGKSLKVKIDEKSKKVVEVKVGRRRIHADPNAAKSARKVIRSYFEACNWVNFLENNIGAAGIDYSGDLDKDLAQWKRRVSQIEDKHLDKALDTLFVR